MQRREKMRREATVIRTFCRRSDKNRDPHAVCSISGIAPSVSQGSCVFTDYRQRITKKVMSKAGRQGGRETWRLGRLAVILSPDAQQNTLS